jgi:light-regulated signal transduction histidine kinase (bacteriophytochrome)
MRLAFANLLSNALKFTRGRSPARVTVGKIDRDGERIYFVEDNGAGFDMRFADKLFGVFQRLHPESEYEGSGIGLASVYRIVTRHGGRIWAAAEVDRGATFFFTLGAVE